MRRVEALRWDVGAALPANARAALSTLEQRHLRSYSALLARYMGEAGVDLMRDRVPPKAPFVLVRLAEGVADTAIVVASGERLALKKGATVYARRTDIEPLVRSGVLVHVTEQGL